MGRRGLALVVAAGLSFAGCGGDGASSRSDYTKRATAICRAAQGNLRRVGDPGTDVTLVTFARRTAAVIRRQADALAGREAPAEIAADMSRAVALLRRLREELLELQQFASARNPGRIQRSLVAAKALDDEGDVILKRVGLSACAG